MIRRCTLLLAAVLCFVALRAEARLVDRVAAVVNDQIVLLSDLHDRLAPVMPQLKQIPDPQTRKARLQQLRDQALEQMIGEKLISQQAKKLKISISERDLQIGLQELMNKNNLDEEQLKQALAREGKTLDSYKEQMLRPQLERMRVLQIQVRPRVSVGEDEIKALYQKNLRELGVETKVRARHIFVLIPPGANADVIGERKRVALDLLKQINEGADFAELAREHSQDSITRHEGGDLGYFGPGTLPANIEKVVFAMGKGEISQPLRSERGFHIIRVEDRRESAALPLQDVEAQLRQQIFAEKMEKATKAWLAELRKKSYIDIKM